MLIRQGGQRLLLLDWGGSPYYRTVQTCEEILQAFNPEQVRGMREEPRMAEQQFGNLQNLASIKKSKTERQKYGRFFYRFPDGEAGLDVYTRVTSFIDTLRRDHTEENCTVIIVTHGTSSSTQSSEVSPAGLALRLFLMAWFQWTVNPPRIVLDHLPFLPLPSPAS
eukprot:747253-Hanusia_phi.AAC.5